MGDKHEMTAEEYRLLAEKHQQEVTALWRIFVTTGVIMLASFVAFVIGALAWFASNKEVTAEGMQVRLQGDTFLLAAQKSEVIDYGTDENLLDALNIFKVPENEYLYSDGNYYATTESNVEIQWLMSDTFHLENDTRSDEDSVEEGLQPGTAGILRFFIIPLEDGAQTINCTISNVPYVESALEDESAISFQKKRRNPLTGEVLQTDDVNAIVVSDDTVNGLLQGHILFFEAYEDGIYDDWLQPEDGTLRFQVELPADTVARQPIEKRIYWVWPNVLAQMILEDGDILLGGRNQLIASSQQEKIVAEMTDGALCEHYFYDAELDRESVAYIQTVYDNSHTHQPVNQQKYGYVSGRYNAGDQYIGKNVNYMVLRLTAQ